MVLEIFNNQKRYERENIDCFANFPDVLEEGSASKREEGAYALLEECAPSTRKENALTLLEECAPSKREESALTLLEECIPSKREEDVYSLLEKQQQQESRNRLHKISPSSSSTSLTSFPNEVAEQQEIESNSKAQADEIYSEQLLSSMPQYPPSSIPKNDGDFPDLLAKCSSKKTSSGNFTSMAITDSDRVQPPVEKSNGLEKRSNNEDDENSNNAAGHQIVNIDKGSIAQPQETLSSLRSSVCAGRSKRSDFPLVRSKACLLVIDVQRYLSEPSSQEEQESSSFFYNNALPRSINNIRTLTESFRTIRDASCTNDDSSSNNNVGCEVIFTYLQACTRDRRDISLDYKLSGPQLSNIPTIGTTHDELFLTSLRPDTQTGRGDILLPKTSCSVFVSTNLDYMLRNLNCEQIVICGQLTDQCVESAVRDAADLGYLVTVVPDACAAKSAECHEKGLHGMKGFCRIVDTARILQELSGESSKESCYDTINDNPTTEYNTGNNTTAQTINFQAKDFQHPVSSIHHSAEMHAVTRYSNPDLVSNYTLALLRTMKRADVRFIRYLTVDLCNTLRCKMIPREQLRMDQAGSGYTDGSTIDHDLNYQCALATVSLAGLPNYADSMVEDTGLDARNVLCLQPDLSTFRILPYAPKSAVVMVTLHDPNQNNAISEVCTRGLIQKVVTMARTELGIDFCVGAEIEFCLHDLVSGKPVDSSMYCNTTTLNQREDFICDLYDQLREQDIPIETLHSESAPGQLEIVIRYQDDPVRLVDMVVLAQETIRAVSRFHSMKALFLPKIHSTQAGNGLHLHLSFRDRTSNTNTFAAATPDASDSGLSLRGQSFLEGILRHLPALLSLTMPTSNSFRRVGAGCWTGHNVEWAVEDKESPLRVCSNLRNTRQWEHVEYKTCDNTGNLYLGLAAVLISGMDGMRERWPLRQPRQDKDQNHADTSHASISKALPKSLQESLNHLEHDELLTSFMGVILTRAYVALRKNEAKRSSNMSLEDEVEEALQNS